MSNTQLEDTCFKDYEHFEKYRNLLIDGEQKVSEGLDKAILAISSASLGLIFAFSKSIWAEDNLVGVSWLKSSWVFVGLALFSVLLSLSLSGLIYHLNRKQCDLIMKNRSKIITELRVSSQTVLNKIEFTEKYFLEKTTLIFHFSSPALLIIGVLFIGIFFNLNFGYKSNEQQTNTTTETNSISSRTIGQANSNSAATTSPQITTNKEKNINNEEKDLKKNKNQN